MSLLIGSERMLIEGELRPAVLRIEGDRIAQVWWGTSDPDRVAGDGDDDVVLGGPPVGTPGRPSQTLSAGDAVVLPGVVDTHVHVNEPGRTEWEGFRSASRAAALGGVTTIVDMPLNSIPPTTTVEALRVKQRAALAAGLACDVGFWGGAVPGNVEHLEPLWDAGVFGFKCFLADSGVPEFPPLGPDELLAAMDRLARFGGLMIVHAEDPGVLAAAPARPGPAYADFLLSRPEEAETTAVARLLDVVRETGTRTHVLHVSSARVLDLLAAAKGEGLPVTAETCHHYLTIAAEDIPAGDPAFKCCPPIRDRGNQDALWDGLRDGILDCVVSDHSPATAAEKYGAKRPGAVDLQQAWGGISGLQAGFLALADAARRRGVSLADVSRWTARNTAALAGLDRADRPKGVIAEGAAADLIVYRPDVTRTIDVADLAHRNPISAYAGMTITGDLDATILGGRLVANSFSDAVAHGELDGGTRHPAPDFDHVLGGGKLLARPGSPAAQKGIA
ncbi:allantoinase AllB [Myceligenerans pegani]|uniref:allantoinase n=1 Tax=Myceligenerans pegani TaxID=2776917 RepID=A0ABR9N2D5_9MICO|nr:allantoinase AllB [Myceligenerans sp. TRM 65318]MBE1877803.1 allantoinase AllB [Myceligenerans sp. TRM 65318]MBE3020074.1 allantoinase AllB [Myceligenerans sp. TRM 65318]